MIKASFEAWDDWLETVKDVCVCKGYDYSKLVENYSFSKAYSEFDCKPEEAVREAVGQ